jgi:putative transcriptional regulator
MIKCKLKVILAINEMTQKELAEKTGIRPPTISAMANNTAKHYPVDVMDKICSVLHCGIGELLEFIPEDDK